MTRKPQPFAHLKPHFAALCVAMAVLGALLLVRGAPAELLETAVSMPLEVRFQKALGRAPVPDPSIKVFSFDDSAYAQLGGQEPRGKEWAAMLRKLALAKPSAIYVPHLFTQRELGDDGGALRDVLTELQRDGLPVYVGSFANSFRIRFRDPLPLEVDPHLMAPPVEARTHLDYNLYGPPPEDRGRFAGVGHLGYDGDGRVRAFIRLREDRFVRHLSLLGATLERARTVVKANGRPLPLDDEGRLRLPIVPPDVMAARIKSVRALLRDEGEKAAHVEPGDVVLILTDMYTGGASFVQTGFGPLPGGFVFYSALSAAVTASYPSPLPLGSAVAVGLALGLTLLGIFTTGRAFAAGLSLAVFGIAGGGLALFAFWNVYAPWLAALAAGVPAAMLAHARKVDGRLESERARSIKTERENAKLGAIVRTAQMFAHDVRKPFSMLKMAIEAVQREPDPAQSKALFTRLFPELSRAMSSVEDMIKDVMEIDGEATLTRTEVAVERLIDRSLREVILLRPEATVRFDYRFEHTLDVEVDAAKIGRALLNVLDNAVQAMQGSGRIWFATRDFADAKGKAFVELVVGNEKSYIPPDDAERVFEAFFTAGKKGGTGLGLAIAHKAVTAHGGKITCRSSKLAGTEFVIALPAAHATPRPRDGRGLPLDAAATLRPYTELRETDDPMLAVALEQALRDLGRPLVVLVVDDESFYRESVAAAVRAAAPSSTPPTVLVAASVEEALAVDQLRRPHLVLADVDLGPEAPNGFELIQRLRARRDDALLVVHSNRILPTDARLGEAAGADDFLPKPATKAGLVKILAAAARRAHTPAAGRPLLAVVDDSIFALEAWRLIARDAEVLAFESPRAFWRAIDDDPELLGKLGLLVTDYYFDNETSENGVSFATRVRAQRPDLVIFLSSNAEGIELPAGVVDGRIGKDPASYAELVRKRTA